MEDAYVIKKTKVSAWFWVSLVLAFFLIGLYHDYRLAVARAHRFEEYSTKLIREIEIRSIFDKGIRHF